MKILYHNTLPPSSLPDAEAVHNELEGLANYFGGDIIQVHPGKIGNFHIPKELYGLPKLRQIKRMDREVDAHHIVFPFFYDFLYTRLLTKPIVYTCTTSKSVRYVNSSRLSQYSIITEGESQFEGYKNGNFKSVTKVRPGINTYRWKITEPPVRQKFTLLMASAPHTLRQFRSKQIYLLMDLLSAQPELNLILVWRGVHTQAIKQLIIDRHLDDRIELVDERVDMQVYFDLSHSTILMCDEPGVLKNYPHSLMESICCGRPVITSQNIEISKVVKSHQLGYVLQDHSIDDLSRAITYVREHYDHLVEDVRRFDTSVLSMKTYIDKVAQVYQQLL